MKYFFASLILICLLSPTGALAASGLSFSITPTLFEMSANKGQSWTSSIKVVNNNRFNLTVYASVVNFAPRGETGQGQFIPVPPNERTGATLAEWITVPTDPITIKPEQSAAIPISVHVPNDATPGGHFAAIMIGTVPPKTDHQVVVSTSQVVTSLFFLRVSGNVVEKGDVRTFTVQHQFVEQPQATFDVRFENTGNVLLQPQGEIDITNMWGQNRGTIPINQETLFGNVLPNSIRKFEFTWKGQYSFTDIGLYTARLTLGYGQQSKQFDTSVVRFWVIPVKAVALVLGSLLAMIWFVSWLIRSYVRRMLAQSVDAYIPRSQRAALKFGQKGDVTIQRIPSMPTKSVAQTSTTQQMQVKWARWYEKSQNVAASLRRYWKPLVSIVVLVLISILIYLYFASVFKHARNYEVTVNADGTPVTLSSEKIMYDEHHTHTATATTTAHLATSTVQMYRLRLINSSDTPGAAAALKTTLVKHGYQVRSLSSDWGPNKNHTVIVYDTRMQAKALTLSKLLGSALLSAAPATTSATSTISIYIGNDYHPPQ